MNEYHTNSLEQTKKAAHDIANILNAGDIVLLSGELGAGKTTLVKEIGKYLGIEEEITSPTFSLMNIYTLPKPVRHIKQIVHVDTYRMEDLEEIRDIGIEEYLGDAHTICFIEWPEKILPLTQHHTSVSIMLLHNNGGRTIQIT